PAPDSKKETCSVCSGSGTVREAKRSLFGSFTSLSECVKCHGTGEIIKNPCPACRGEGILKKEEEIEINIPAGINDGEMIRMAGSGEAKPMGNSGDLYIKIHVEGHPRFWREGNNIITELEIPMTEAALGGEKTIEALDGRIKISVPQGVESGDILRIKSRGVSKKYGGRGDLLFKTKVKMPKKLSKKAKDLIEELKKEGI
ncbi:MAG: DnaJ C-terminal domain-containing protein, partial [Patescibacteria group bacterium]